METSPSLPRSPSAYRPAVHFGQQRRDRGVPGEAIAACIKDGDIRDSDDHDGYEMRATVGGVCYWVAVIPPAERDESKGLVKSCGFCG